MLNPAYEELFRLPPEERLELVYDLMESLEDADNSALRPWQAAELALRREDALANPDKLIGWDEVQTKLDDVLDQSSK